jgi:hypothetical protein
MAFQGLGPKNAYAQIDKLEPTGEPVRLASFGMAISLSQIGLRPCFYVADDVGLFVKLLNRYAEEIRWLMDTVGCQVWIRLESMPEMSGLEKIRATIITEEGEWSWLGGVLGDAVDYPVIDDERTWNLIQQTAAMFSIYQAMVDLLLGREDRFRDYLALFRTHYEGSKSQGEQDPLWWLNPGYLPDSGPSASGERSDDEVLATVVAADASAADPYQAQRVFPEFGQILVQPPSGSSIGEGSRSGERSYRAVKCDFAATDAANRDLGSKGEEFVVEYERRVLTRAGRGELAAQVRRISETEGDGAGYDILSFEENGVEKYIEVKTTTRGIESPFLVTLNEVEFSGDHAAQYRLYRVFDFARSPRIFVLEGSLRDACILEAVQFRARVQRS